MPISLIIDVQISNKDSYAPYVQKAQVIVKNTVVNACQEVLK